MSLLTEMPSLVVETGRLEELGREMENCLLLAHDDLMIYGPNSPFHQTREENIRQARVSLFREYHRLVDVFVTAGELRGDAERTRRREDRELADRQIPLMPAGLQRLCPLVEMLHRAPFTGPELIRALVQLLDVALFEAFTILFVETVLRANAKDSRSFFYQRLRSRRFVPASSAHPLTDLGRNLHLLQEGTGPQRADALREFVRIVSAALLRPLDFYSWANVVQRKDEIVQAAKSIRDDIISTFAAFETPPQVTVDLDMINHNFEHADAFAGLGLLRAFS
ncbi:hypothetical protein QBC34DRAFT_460922 [Podospora aff. communis PSN243]|uniref:Uncharacterized protein n=1 Tax=Podospora aff. communis PSN243 TaxID=3040156 RepID=A0AAV9GSR6_9PEZI|nr:hypothetical protein QBC34DRAFT_460922 [Podospora aff. communis PSN243]